MKIQNLLKNKKGFIRTLNFSKKKSLVCGFSIIEIIIYLSIFTFISIFVVNALIVSMSSFSTTSTNHALLEGGLSSMDRISREVRQANSIDSIDIDNSPGTLQLNSTDTLGKVIAVKIKKETDLSLNIYKSVYTSPTNLVLVDNLLNSSIVVDSLIFRRIDTKAGEAVKIEMTLRDTKSKNNRSANFYDTVILRGSY